MASKFSTTFPLPYMCKETLIIYQSLCDSMCKRHLSLNISCQVSCWKVKPRNGLLDYNDETKKCSQRPHLLYIYTVIGLENHKQCPKVMRAGVAQVLKK